ncbi:cadherin-like beta sandwich domain-containing protein [Paenibacillus cremeus]|uniref:cadherin-like beta sandwich domain-containing protein n=1 Tax=Paenibacillus cremeus TaxID=2163881 RepID=UPI001C96276A|nr:cadherin-like beta sandwich domain-containing protein [Paenibacillus cremeus]
MSTDTNLGLRSIAFSNGKFAAVGGDVGSNSLLTNAYGTTWTPTASSVTSVTVSPSTASVVQGGSQQLTATVSVVGGAAQTVTWSSSDASNKVTVDNTGKVTVASGSTPGTYTITATSTADSTKKGTSTITVTAASSNANLGNLTLSQGTLTPAFASGTTSYTASVGNAVSSLTVTPTVSDSTASVKVNGTAVTSGSASGAVSLNVGANTITVLVTAQDNTTKTYTVTVTRAAPSSNANLSNLTLSQGTLTPAFASGTTSYTASVSNSVASVNVTPTVADSTATVKVNGNAATSGNASTVNLNVGANTITVLVTAQDGTTSKTYTVTVTRAAALSNNANLSNLTLSQGTLTPTFATGTTSYTASVANAVTSMDVTPTLADGTASLKVNGSAATSGNAKTVNLNVGANTITVLVTAQDGTTTKSYTITVTRAAASSNADLSNLTLSQGTLTPAFASGTTSYTASVANAVTSVDVTPTLADGSVTVNGSAATSGNAKTVNLNVGANTITVLVTAQDGTTAKSYTTTVTRAASSNADLSNLTLSQGTLTPAFASGTTSYTASVANAVTSVDVTPTLADGTASVKVNNSAVTSGNAKTVNLNVGANTITVLVTAQDGTTTQSYTVTVTRAASSNADLSNLTLSAGTLTPSFASGTTSYAASVANAVISVDVTPTVADSTASVTVNGSAATSGNAKTVNLNVGANTITVLVTAQDGTTTKSYTVTVTRAASSNADLSNLTLSQGTLTPSFASGTMTYTASVANAVTSVDVTPTLADGTASVKVNNSAVTSGNAKTVNLTVGMNTITVLVTAQDGTTAQSYTVTVMRAASSNADLSNLTLSAATLTPSFASGTTTYTASVANAVTSVDVTPTLADGTASVTVNGSAVTSGNAKAVNLTVGSNTITVLVTAQDGTTTQSYTITVTRAASSNADLSNLTLSQGTLTPTFASGTTSYTASVANAVASVDVTPTLADGTASVTVNGSAVTSGNAKTVNLNVGANTITVLVTAQDVTTTQSYTITVTRAASSNADLSNLTLSAGTLTPAFAFSTTSYTTSVGNSVYGITVTPTVADSTATVKVNGTAVTSGIASGAINLNVGTNTITVLVTAQDNTTKTYAITVTRAASSNADLSNLTLSAGALTPAFASSTTSYTTSVGNSVYGITVTPTVADSAATVKVNGTAVTSGTASGTINLSVGSNTITVLVTAQDNTTKTYTITVTRAPSSNADLSKLTLSSGTVLPTFDPAVTSYTVSVANSVYGITVTPTLADSTASVKVNGASTASGQASGSINLNVGSNPVTIEVTAQDGTQKTYTVHINRAPSSTVVLSSLAVSAGALSPNFSGTNLGYNVSVGNAVSSTTITAAVYGPYTSLKIAGAAMQNGATSAPIALQVGANLIPIEVIAQDGINSQIYTVSVNRAPSDNAVVGSIVLSKGTLSPAFTSSLTDYEARVAYSVVSLTVAASVDQPNAMISIQGIAVTSGAASLIPLQVGVNRITIEATAQDGVTKKTYVVTIYRESLSSSNSGSTTPTTTPVTTDTEVNVLVNGKVENAGTATTSTVNGQTVTTVAVDQKKLEDKLAAEGRNAVVTIPVNIKSDVVVGELNGQMVKSMESKQAILEMKTDKVTYTVPAEQINIDSISSQFGKSVALQDIKIHIEIAAPPAETVKVVQNAAAKGTFALVVPPVNFTVTGTYGNTTVEVSKFNAYVERTIAIPDGVDPSKITTGIVVEPNGTVRHVPTKIVKIDGKYYAKVYSLTNSTYTVVWHPIEFTDVANHWAKAAVNDMGSRMVIEGTGDGIFSPDRDITRAEFAAIIVRGLGLKLENGATPFSDVKSSDWYSSAINTAYAYHLISGFEDGTFRPNDKITREQAMVIIAQAMTITKLKDKLASHAAEDILRSFTDAADASSWAVGGIADSAEAGIVTGREGARLAPKAFITRAEVAAIVQRLLQKSDLI